MIRFRPLVWVAVYAVCATTGHAQPGLIVSHIDPVQVDAQLTLPLLLEQTLKQYPEFQLQQARQQESAAIHQRGEAWLAGPVTLSASYLDDWLADDTGYREFDAQVEIPLWRWGQREAGQTLATQAAQAIERQQQALKLKISGLLRHALWNVRLADSYWQQAKQTLAVSDELLKKIKLRVELGDLPRSDQLLAESDYLQKRSLLMQAEAEVMHARQNFISLSGANRLPAEFFEQQSERVEINPQHPYLSALNARIQRKQAEVDWVSRRGSGQPSIHVGMKSERDTRDGDDIESAGIGFSIPFGGGDFVAPEVAKKNVELTELVAQRDLLYRALQKNLHEAEHRLQIDRAELDVANQLKTIAVKHHEMSQLSFASGEINLMDLLKIQARTEHAIRYAKEQEIKYQRDIAFYNQAVGVLP